MMGFPPPGAQNCHSSHSAGDSHPQDSVNEKQPSVATQVCVERVWKATSTGGNAMRGPRALHMCGIWPCLQFRL